MKISDAMSALIELRAQGFIGPTQYTVLCQLMRGEEKQFFIDKICELKKLIDGMPQTYEQDGKGRDTISYLHYFSGGCDWYITEKDKLNPQRQAFGVANLGWGGELGYISLLEVNQSAELDLHFKPCKLRDIEKAS